MVSCRGMASFVGVPERMFVSVEEKPGSYRAVKSVVNYFWILSRYSLRTHSLRK